jgi:acetyl esterase/lipase
VAAPNRLGRGLVVLIHGGFWRSGYGKDLMEPLADDLCARGWLVANVEYRRVGEGGGWPATGRDVAASLEAVRQVVGEEAGRWAVVGHSAGGQLALWLAAVSSGPPVGVVALAGVSDLDAAAVERLGRGAVKEFLGGAPDRVPKRYAEASPARLLPLRVPQLLVHGDRDDRVPVAMTMDYARRAAAAGDEVVVELCPGGDHFLVINPAGRAWRVVAGQLESWLG